MIIRNTPTNLDGYIAVDNKTSNILHQNGFYPKYIDDSFIYYVRSDKIIKFMMKEDLQCKNM